MIKHIKKYTLLIIITLGIISCNDALDMKPLDEYSDIWDEPDLVEAYINDLYLSMGHGHHEIMLSSLSDETHFTHGYGVPVITESRESPGDRGTFDSRDDLNHLKWEDIYSGIKKVNDFFDNIDEDEINDQEGGALESLKGQAYFLRAYLYHNLLRMYGGVPIITKPATLEEGIEGKLLFERNSFSETVDFIVEQTDSAAALLPAQNEVERGRANKGAALALKSRVLLYAASDLFHENPGGEDFTGYTKGQDRQQMWQDAKDAAQAVIDLGTFSLFQPNPASAEEAEQNYYELFITVGNSESIMERDFLTTRDDGGYNLGLNNLPNGYHNYGGNTPIQALVDDYQMQDGSDFSWDNPDKAGKPYENRDPRLNASILHDGSPWMERPSDLKKYDNDNRIQTIEKIKLPDGEVSGLDTRNSPNEDWNGSYTAYYLKKFIRDDVNHGTSTKQEGLWFFFRYTEVLLNYVEASIELGDEEDARRVLNEIRSRAYMPSYDSSVNGEELMDAYRNERRVEMAFEGVRFFDVRRWMIAPKVMDKDVQKIEITAEATDRAIRSTYSNFVYEVKNIGPGKRSWNDKMYFQPIPKEEMNRNDKLEQNPGY